VALHGEDTQAQRSATLELGEGGRFPPLGVVRAQFALASQFPDFFSPNPPLIPQAGGEQADRGEGYDPAHQAPGGSPAGAQKFTVEPNSTLLCPASSPPRPVRYCAAERSGGAGGV